MRALRRALRSTLGAVRRRVSPTPVERRVASLGLTPGDLAIDCGANVGQVTAALARTGADVHAFEPNPAAFAVLSARLGHMVNVSLHPEAVLDRAGSARLYLHVDSPDDPIAASIGSSILPFKGNVDPDSHVDVQAVDLSDFVRALDRPVAFLKIDVEGAECAILERLLDTGAIDRVRMTVVELHDRHIPELRAQNSRMRERIVREGLADRVLTDWE